MGKAFAKQMIACNIAVSMLNEGASQESTRYLDENAILGSHASTDHHGSRSG